MEIHAVISDMDGVIVNSEHEHFLSFQKMLRVDYGIAFTHEENEAFLGRTDEDIFTTLKFRYPQINEPLPELITRRTDFFIEIFKERAQPLPGVIPLFDSLTTQGIPIALGTAASRGVADFVLETLKLKNYFKTVVCASDVERGKPEPDIFLEAARRLGVKPQNCLVLEDSNYGVRAAKAAGMKCIAIPCGPTLTQDHSLADLIVKSLIEITPEVLRHL